ncbi:MAG: hypothetical protein DYG89_37880 [Caldilinea sp. CFX5]|nr:hypothetical protein [Caldilinea sp. CFX5]
MKRSYTLIGLTCLVAVLAFIAAGGAFLWPAADAPALFTTAHGETVQLYGQGLYRYDSLLIGSGYRGQDLVVLVVGLPLLVIALLFYWRGSLRGGLLLTGMLAYLLYYGVSMVFGAAYNPLFLVYIALYSAGLFAFVLAFAAIDQQSLPAALSSALPHRGIAIFLFVIAVVLCVVWLGLSLAPAMVQGRPPAELAHYTTLLTHALDLGIMVPVSILAGILLLRRSGLGYLLTAIMLIFSWLIGVTIAASTLAQWLAGYPYTIGQLIGMVAPFMVLAVVGLRYTVLFFRTVVETAKGQPADDKTTQMQPAPV